MGNGARPEETVGDGASPIFPKWAWASVGDRVWLNGAWVYDIGHPEGEEAPFKYRTEIHPPPGHRHDAA